jgi:SAM-dependent methyltransferase
LLLIVYSYKYVSGLNKKEGFHQDSPFILKQNQAIYDDFYAKYYDELYACAELSDFIVAQVIDMTLPSKEYSVFLDVGSGTGALIDALQQSGYTVYGIDKSQAMIDYSESIRPDIQVKCGDFVDPLAFEQNTFSHVLCVGRTLYEIDDKYDFFRNCYYWLKSGGYLIVNLVDPEDFDTVLPGAKTKYTMNVQKHTNKRVLETEIDFSNVVYKSKMDFNKKNENTCNCKMIENFIDNASGNVIQNERIMVMESKKVLVEMAEKAGFVVYGETKYIGDEHEYLTIFQRI